MMRGQGNGVGFEPMSNPITQRQFFHRAALRAVTSELCLMAGADAPCATVLTVSKTRWKAVRGC